MVEVGDPWAFVDYEADCILDGLENMPRSIDPDARVDIVLTTDKDKSPKPTFQFKTITVKEEEKLGRIYDAATGDEENELSNRVKEYLEPLLLGWSNMGEFEFGKHSLQDVVCFAEAMDLAGQLLESGRLSIDEKKRSESEASLGAESSVNHASQTDAENITKT